MDSMLSLSFDWGFTAITSRKNRERRTKSNGTVTNPFGPRSDWSILMDPNGWSSLAILEVLREMAYYYRDYGGPAIGPASEAELVKLAKLGVISSTTEVRSGMSPTWFAATKIPGIVFTAQSDDIPESTPENANGETEGLAADTADPEISAKLASSAQHFTPKHWWSVFEIGLEIGCVTMIAHILYYTQPPTNVIATCTHRIPFSPLGTVIVLAAVWGVLLLGRLIRIWRQH